MAEEKRLKLNSLSRIRYHSSPSSLHLSVWHVQTAALIQLGSDAFIVLCSITALPFFWLRMLFHFSF